MLFQNKLENIIKDGKKTSVWLDDVDRRKYILKSLDFYNNRQDYYLKADLARLYPASHTKMERYAETYPLTQRIIDDTSILFQNPVEVNIDKDTLIDDFNEMLNKSKFQSILDKINHYVNLTYKVGVMPVYRDNKIDLDVITADMCFVYQEPGNPTKITDLFIHVSGLDQTPKDTVDHRLDYYVRWNKEIQSVVQIDISNGKIINEMNIQPNPYKVIPVVWFEDTINVNNFWPDKLNSLIEANSWVNIDQCNLNLMYSFQAYSTLVLTGMDDKTLKDIKWGPQSLIALPIKNDLSNIQPKAEYITPNPALEAYQKAIEQKKIDAAQSAGLSAAAYRKDNTQINSGYQLKLSNETLIKRIKSARQQYLPSILELIQLMMNIWSTNSATKSFPEDTKITINYGEITYDSDPIAEAQLDQIKLTQGLTSQIRLLMKDDPDLSIEQATELYKALSEERNTVVNLNTSRLEQVLSGRTSGTPEV